MKDQECLSRITRREFVTTVGSAALGTAVLGGACGGGGGGPDLAADVPADAADAPPEVQKPDLSRTAFLVEGMPQPATGALPDRYHHPALEALLATMAANGLALYRSGAKADLAAPDGIVARDDVVVIKVNGQWKGKGGTNTDLLKGLVTRLVEHPDSFAGEVVIADNRQDLFTGSFDADPNSDDPAGTVAHVVSAFQDFAVATFAWDSIRGSKVPADGAWADGYVQLDGYVSYPRFTTAKGTRVDLKRGVLGAGGYEDRLRLINMPVLKSHVMTGATATLKHYMGVLDVGAMGEDLMKGIHGALIHDGLMARMMKDVRMPDLNVLDALWVMHQPPYGPQGGDGPVYREKGFRWVGSLLGGLDPVAIDHAAVSRILYPSAVVAPCGDLHPFKATCVDDPPCKATGRCERMNPDLVDGRLLNASFALAAMLGDAPVDALATYLKSSSLVLHGEPKPGADTYDLVLGKV